MKKYIPVDFDEKGNAVLGTPKNTPTSNGFIPTTWAPPTPVSEGSGLKSISISPVLETTPALDTVYPIYWEEGASYPPILLLADDLLPDTLTVTITPTQDWYAFDGGSFGGVGESVTFSVEKDDDDMPFRVAVASELAEEPEKFISFNVRIGQGQ